MNTIDLIIAGICGGICYAAACAWMRYLLKMLDRSSGLIISGCKAVPAKKELFFTWPVITYMIFAGYGILTAVGLTWYWGFTAKMFTALVFFAVLSILTLIDVAGQVIPPALNVALLAIGVVSLFTIPEPGVVQKLLGTVCVSVPMFLLTMFVSAGFGGGDIKLMAAAGMMLGAKNIMLAFLIGLVIGGAYSIFLLIGRNEVKKNRFAFGPCLSLGLKLALLYGI